MTPEDMKKRTKAFALRCIRLAASFPRGPAGDVIGRQLIKASTSVAANYHSACAARSHADFLNKLGIVEEEAEESAFWIDFAADGNLTKRALVESLLTEGQAILKIVAASKKTARKRRAERQRPTARRLAPTGSVRPNGQSKMENGK
jgi:four helix bundle protein